MNIVLKPPVGPLYAPKSSYWCKLVVLPKLMLTVLFLDLLRGQLGRGAPLLPVPLPQTVRSTSAGMRKAAGSGLPRASLGGASALLLWQAALCLQAQGPGPAMWTAGPGEGDAQAAASAGTPRQAFCTDSWVGSAGLAWLSQL